MRFRIKPVTGLLFTHIIAVLLMLSSVTALAQSNTGRIVGTVSSSDGAIRGANIKIKDNQTGKEKSVVSSDNGTFSVPQLEVGTYTLTISMSGFKTNTISDVKIDLGREYSLNTNLTVGNVEETIVVTAGTDVLNATNGELSSTISPRQVTDLPLNGRNPLNLLQLQAGTSSNSAQNSSINGLRTSFSNITRDGLNIQDGFIRSNATDFAPNRPSVDDTSEITVITSNSGADQNGGAQVRSVTPRGESKYHGSLFEFNRNSSIASNSFFSNLSGNPVSFLNRNNFGGKLGGPVALPGIKEKAFFFFAYEGLRQRSQSLRRRTILTPTARQGIFQYKTNLTENLPANCNPQTKICSVNILGMDPNITSIDPVVSSRILNLLPTEGNRIDIGDGLNTTGYSFRQPNNVGRNVYTTRIDYEISERHSINGVYSYNREDNLRPDVDGFEGYATTPVTNQFSKNRFMAIAYRMIPSARLTNELRGGFFRSEVPFDRTSDNPDYFIAHRGVVAEPLVSGLISNPNVTFLDQGRNTRYYNVQDNAEYTLGSHSIRFGGQFQKQAVDAYNEAGAGTSIVPNYVLGVNPNTPQLKATQFSGIDTNQLAVANNLFALLGGIVSSGNQAFNVENKDSGFKGIRRFEDFEYGNHSLYIQDQWRFKSSLTLNLGLRYEIFTALEQKNGLALEPVIASGQSPVEAILNKDGVYDFVGGNAGSSNRFYKTDKNNIAPILSVAYTPQFSNEWLKKTFGDGKTVIRGGYRMSYLNDQMITALRSANLGNSGLGTTATSLLNPATNSAETNYRAKDLPFNITAPTVKVPRTYADNNTSRFNRFGTVFAIDPNLQTPKVHEYNFGLQREFGANAIEIRYVGGRSDNLWRGLDYNQIDIRGNGFVADFNRARANLLLTGNPACTTAGCQTLTVFPNLANSGDVNTTAVINQLRNGTPADLARSYITGGKTGTVQFLPNSNTGMAMLLENGSMYRYNSLQAEYRRRFSKGLFLQANYTFQKTLTNAVGTAQNLVEPYLDLNNPRLEYSRADFDTTHIFNANSVYELPFGKGRTFASNAGRWMDMLIGGWQINNIVRLTSGAPITITDNRGTLNRSSDGRSQRQTAYSNLTKDQIKNLIGIYKTDKGVYFIDPKVIASTGRAANGYGSIPFEGQAFFNVNPGETGNLERAFINGPIFFNVDASIAKRIKFTEGISIQLRLEVFNALNRANFGVNATQQFSLFDINSAEFGKINQTSDPRIVQIGARIDF